MNDEIRSMAEFERRYYPSRAEEREYKEAMKDPKRFGELLAEQSLDKLRKLLKENHKMGVDKALDDLFRALEVWYESCKIGTIADFNEASYLLILAYEEWFDLVKEDTPGESDG